MEICLEVILSIYYLWSFNQVMDPYWFPAFNADTYPAFLCRHEYGSRDLMLKNCQILQVNSLYIFAQKLQDNPRPLWRTTSYTGENIQRFKTKRFFPFSFLLRVIFFYLDLYRSGSTTSTAFNLPVVWRERILAFHSKLLKISLIVILKKTK